jgi:hypothetical protein
MDEEKGPEERRTEIIKISKAVHRQIKVAAANAGTPIYAIAEKAIEAWIIKPADRSVGSSVPDMKPFAEAHTAHLPLLQTINSKLDSVLELLRVTHGAIGGIASQQHEQDRDRTLQQLAEATDEIRRDLATVRTRGKPGPSRPKNSLRAG